MLAQPAPVARRYEREDELAAALSALEPGAWRQLFEENYERVYNYAFIRTGNAADADDIASTVFVEAVKGIGRYQYRGSPVVAWLFRIAHNETVDVLKRRQRTGAQPLDAPAISDRLRARDVISHADERADVAEALGRLRPEHRDVLLLRLVEGRSVRDVAELLGKTEGAVKVLQMRALRALKDRLAG
ncbi:MAG TPA: sigma-70 family RNA polymerase sigma factor [Dehalococcoidia bacterium]|nr:sigma-70 family RNA polymerase sigma factor [Dehalococcoidia bacterium]